MRGMKNVYPAIDMPSSPTWDDIERLALHYPQMHEAVVLVQRGDLTREQALVRLALALASAWQRLYQAEVDWLMVTPSRPLLTPEDRT